MITVNFDLFLVHFANSIISYHFFSIFVVAIELHISLVFHHQPALNEVLMFQVPNCFLFLQTKLNVFIVESSALQILQGGAFLSDVYHIHPYHNKSVCCCFLRCNFRIQKTNFQSTPVKLGMQTYILFWKFYNFQIIYVIFIVIIIQLFQFFLQIYATEHFHYSL